MKFVLIAIGSYITIMAFGFAMDHLVDPLEHCHKAPIISWCDGGGERAVIAEVPK